MSSKIDETLEQLQTGIEELYQSDKYKQYLDTMSKFHSYSVNNCILIAMQKPDASLVAGYTAWRDKFHRQVLKGEKGITIIAPNPHKKKQKVEVKDADGMPVLDREGNPVTEEREYVHQTFRIAKVFDVSQTDGEPIITLTAELKNPVEGFDDYLDVIKELSPVPVRFDNIESGAKGYFSPSKQEIVIQRGMPEEQTIKTLLHECAHARLGHCGEDDHFDRNTKEVQAESVAYVFSKALGLDTSEYSFGYIAGWYSGREQKELKASIQTIRDQSDQMITGIEKNADAYVYTAGKTSNGLKDRDKIYKNDILERHDYEKKEKVDAMECILLYRNPMVCNLYRWRNISKKMVHGKLHERMMSLRTSSSITMTTRYCT